MPSGQPVEFVNSDWYQPQTFEEVGCDIGSSIFALAPELPPRLLHGGYFLATAKLWLTGVAAL
jgi:hypothetical protein